MTKHKTNNKQTKPLFFASLKNILFAVIIAIFCHIFYVNIMISIHNHTIHDLLVITANEDILSPRLSENNKNHLDKNIDFFNKNQMKKILILWQTSQNNISEWQIIRDYLLDNDIWWGHIIQIDTYKSDYYKETLWVLSNQQIPTASVLSDFWNYYEYNKLFHAKNYKKITVNVYYSGWKNFCRDLFINYYNFWKNLA